MPKLRPLRKAEEISAVPATEPVTIDISEEVQTETPLKTEEIKVVHAAPKTPERAELDPEEESPLKQQLEAAEKAKKIAEGLAAQERARAETALRQTRERDQELERERQTGDQARYDAIVGQISAEQANADKAQADYEASYATGDTKAQAEANRRMLRAEARLEAFERDKAAFEARREERKVEKTEPQQPQLPKVARDWLDEHPEYMSDPKKNRQIGRVHDMVTEDEGITPWSPEYFLSLESHLGIKKKADPDPDLEPDPQPRAQRRSAPVSAPVSRDTPSLSNGNIRPREVTLNPEEREIARVSGISEVEYAKNKVKLETMKRQGYYQEQG